MAWPWADRLPVIVSRSPACAFAWFVVNDRRTLSGVVSSSSGSARPQNLFARRTSESAPQYLARGGGPGSGLPCASPQIVRKKFSRDRLQPTTPDDVDRAFAQVRRHFPRVTDDDRRPPLHGGVVPLQRLVRRVCPGQAGCRCRHHDEAEEHLAPQVRRHAQGRTRQWVVTRVRRRGAVARLRQRTRVVIVCDTGPIVALTPLSWRLPSAWEHATLRRSSVGTSRRSRRRTAATSLCCRGLFRR